ncbi:hypothetical protein T06_10362 [Trichinella sp. T6]|nr:hypothetical protein T06_10362 [Trichinella sp. T6]
MLQVRMAASSLMLEPAANTSICLDAHCHNKQSSPAFVPTMIGQFWILLCPVAVHRGLYPFKKRKTARCGSFGGSFLIING